MTPARRLAWLLAALPLLAVGRASATDPGAGEAALRQGCLEATRRAVALELKGAEGRLAAARGGLGPAENIERFGGQVARLSKEQARFGAMKAADYPLPDGRAEPEPALLAPGDFGPLAPPRQKVISIVAGKTCGEGSLLVADDQSRSGPFYHLAGIRGGDCRVLRPGRRYELEVYLVYRRDYVGFIQDHHVYVAAYQAR